MVQAQHGDEEMSYQGEVKDMRTRYLSAMKAEYTERVEQGHLSSEQYAALNEVRGACLRCGILCAWVPRFGAHVPDTRVPHA